MSPNPGQADQVQVHQSGGPVLERPIAAGSDEEKAIASWLRTHKDGWRLDLATYAPARRVRGEDFTLDFHKDRCILNYRTNNHGDWAQVSRQMQENESIPEVFAPSR